MGRAAIAAALKPLTRISRRVASTIYIQKDDLGADKQWNWLPATRWKVRPHDATLRGGDSNPQGLLLAAGKHVLHRAERCLLQVARLLRVERLSGRYGEGGRNFRSASPIPSAAVVVAARRVFILVLCNDIV
jgi:hypothetical protein